MSGMVEEPVTFDCGGAPLVGVLHRPARPRGWGVVIVVGGPQYRIGAHRQYVLAARDLAAAGYPVLRFDYRGMGDSGGPYAGFEGIGEDIRAAVDLLFEKVPGLDRAVLWGLCDGASASAFYAPTDSRIGGLVLLNPWVRSALTLARAQVRYYYVKRVLSRDFWAKLLGGRVEVRHAAGDFLSKLGSLRRRPEETAAAAGDRPEPGGGDLAERVTGALLDYDGSVLLILSGDDFSAREFDSAVLQGRPMKPWRKRPQVAVRHLEGANHTYSETVWRRQVHAWVLAWLGDR